MNRSSSNYKRKTSFAHDLDNLQKSIKSFTVTKTFNSQTDKWKQARDFARDPDLSWKERQRQSLLNVEINFPVSVNNVKFNTGLNADLAYEMKDVRGTVYELLHSFVVDYELNHRQMAVYMIDCEVLNCEQNNRRFQEVVELTKGSPITILFFNDAKPIEVYKLAKQIKELAEQVIENKAVVEQSPPEILFIKEYLRQLDSYLEGTVLPEINRFKRALSGFKFKSPLNFIMMGKDFHEFFGFFYHFKLLTQYLTNFITDSVFSLHNLHVKS